MKRYIIDKLITNKQREKERERLLCTNILIPYKYHLKFSLSHFWYVFRIFGKKTRKKRKKKKRFFTISKTHRLREKKDATKRFVAPSPTMFFFSDDVTFHQQPVHVV